MVDRVRLLQALEAVASHGTPARGAASLIDFGSAGYLDLFEREVIHGMVAHGAGTVRVFEGPYGSGKTHLLRLLSELGERSGMAVVEVELSRSVGFEDLAQLTKLVLQDIECVVQGERVKGLTNVLQAIGIADSVAAERMLQTPVPHPGFRAGMVAGLRMAQLPVGAQLILTRFLQGERVALAALPRYGVGGVRAPLSRRNAAQVLNTVILGLSAAGVRGTMLLFDENEQTLTTARSTPSRRTIEAANLLRRIIDASMSSRLGAVVSVFAVLPDFVRRCAEVYPALGQRLGNVHVDYPAWRAPYLHVDDIVRVHGPLEFLEGVAGRLVGLLEGAKVDVSGLKDELRAAGEGVLVQHAGAGYRRPLMKRLAQVAVGRMENGGRGGS